MELKDIRCFLMDMDGTIYLGDELIPGAKDFIDLVRKQGKRIIFMTNNSSKSSKRYIEKLNRYGIDVTKEEVFTSGEATTIYLNEQKPKAKVFLLGNEDLEEEFIEAGFELVKQRDNNPDFVVLGFDTTLTYEKLWIACDYIRDGVKYIATHPDFNCPLSGGKWMPDTGSMIEMIYASTKARPKIIGKPNKRIVDLIKHKYGYKNSEMAMVGDRIYTDILLGNNANINSILVLTGETDIDSYNDQSEVKADFVYASVEDIKNDIL